MQLSWHYVHVCEDKSFASIPAANMTAASGAALPIKPQPSTYICSFVYATYICM